MSPYFAVRQHHDQTAVEFQIEALTTSTELEQVGHALYRLVDEDGHRRLVLDFTRVKVLSSQAIGIILTVNKKLGQFKGATLVLCGLSPDLMKVLKITRLDKLLKIVPTQADALKVK